MNYVDSYGEGDRGYRRGFGIEADIEVQSDRGKRIGRTHAYVALEAIR